MAVVAALAPGCATRPNTVVRPTVPTHEPWRRPQYRLDQLHAALRQYKEPHDAYIYLIQQADETSVPLLLERFRVDHPQTPPEPPPPDPTWIDPFPYSVGRVGPVVSRGIQGFACVHDHLVDALSFATNTNRGMYYPAWQAWWSENRHKPRREWIAQGFREAGLSPSDPIDQPFALDLIGLLAGRRAYLAANARRLLEHVPVTERIVWIEKAARSDQRLRRLGAIYALRDLKRGGHEELLRTLTADPDPEVRRAALETLKR